ncbi:NAD-dependent epimerase/dehydratase family protein [Candidatus Pseudothioglobus singularis]|nr:NAD-dependent epimerase/dehydratase family protein [Candidatus Pseudothioglobus singularis]
MKKVILVTGGAGFIGSHLCEKLAQNNNNKVYSLDNYSTGTTKNHVKNVEYIIGSTVDISSLISFNPNYIYHLGEYSRVEQSFEDIHEVWKSNKNGIFSILEFTRKTGAKLIYAGSSTKFGDGGLGRSQSPYAWTKASNTELVANYGDWFNISFAITYFYNVYGDREIATGKYATLIALFSHQKQNNKTLTVVSPGTQRRNFTHINDIISGLILIGNDGYGDDYGIGCKESYTVLEVAEMFGGNIEMLPERKGNRLSAEVVTKKTVELGWTSKENLKDYIENFEK